MFFILACVILMLLYFYGKRNHKYWKLKGVKYEEPLVFFGSSLNNTIKGVCFSDRFVDLYKSYPNEKYVGFFEGSTPALLIRDPEIIQHILKNGFRHFHNRGANGSDANEPLLKNIFNVDGDVWKLVRQKITPAFTSAKLKAMFPLIVQQAEKLLEIADDYAKSAVEINAHELMARYTTDFIGACGFGLDVDSQNDGNSDFRKLGKRIFTFTKRDICVGLCKKMAPKLFKSIHYVSPELENGTMKLIKYVTGQRNNKPSGRHDFIDMMLELKEKGKLVGESLDKRNPDGSMETVEIVVDDDLIAAQVFVFFAAGFETSSSSSSYLLHSLAYHPDIQERCQKEVDEVLARYDGKLCYDSVKDMKYLEMAFKESLRMYAPVGWLQRRCVSDYKVPGTDLVIEAGTDIVISVQALHSDAKLYKDPEQFKPERFDPDNVGALRNVYLPFGDGPRACIGERLGLLQSLAGLVAVLSKFSVSPSENTVRVPKIDPTSNTVSTIIGGLPLLFTRRQ